MTEDTGDISGGVVDRRSSKRRRRLLTELVLIVCPHGRPDAVRAFAEDELNEAQAWADAHNAEVVRLAE
jgi:ABC-type nitrate/sulfonate/bicarbonate transport system substrate-binding protein